MTLLSRPHRRPTQLSFEIEPQSWLDAVGRVAADLPVSPRAIASCFPIDRPDALLWAHRWVERCEAVADIGVGLGGSALLLHQQRSGSTSLVEPDPSAGSHAFDLTGLQIVEAPLDGLPFAADTHDGALALASFGHGPERAGMFPELGRIVRRGGHVSVWTCVSNRPDPIDAANVRFPTLAQLEAEFYAADLAVDEWAPADDFAVEPSWASVQARVLDSVRDTFPTSTLIRDSLQQLRAVRSAIERGDVRSLLYRLSVR